MLFRSSAFYVYLLAYEDRLCELQLRSIGGGSIAPMITHLFTGGVIFESLLKHFYPNKDDGNPTKTLGDIFLTCAFTDDFVTGLSTSASSIQDILSSINDNSLHVAFSTAAKLRNTTGHNLIWDDRFANPDQYSLLFYQEINALLYLISTKFRP